MCVSISLPKQSESNTCAISSAYISEREGSRRKKSPRGLCKQVKNPSAAALFLTRVSTAPRTRKTQASHLFLMRANTWDPAKHHGAFRMDSRRAIAPKICFYASSSPLHETFACKIHLIVARKRKCASRRGNIFVHAHRIPRKPLLSPPCHLRSCRCSSLCLFFDWLTTGGCQMRDPWRKLTFGKL